MLLFWVSGKVNNEHFSGMDATTQCGSWWSPQMASWFWMSAMMRERQHCTLPVGKVRTAAHTHTHTCWRPSFCDTLLKCSYIFPLSFCIFLLFFFNISILFLAISSVTAYRATYCITLHLSPYLPSTPSGHTRVVRLLLGKGALLHRDHQGRTPLHLAAEGGHLATLTAILAVHSHTLDQTDKEGVSEGCNDEW